MPQTEWFGAFFYNSLITSPSPKEKGAFRRQIKMRLRENRRAEAQRN